MCIQNSLNVSPDNATLLYEIRNSVSMEHCFTLFQCVANISNKCRIARIARDGRKPPAALKMSVREGLGIAPWKLHDQD